VALLAGYRATDAVGTGRDSQRPAVPDDGRPLST
jgi:hypothetical protein